MAGLSIWHIVLFAIVFILLFGTSKLRNIGRDVGGAVKDFKDSVKNDDEKARQQIEQDLIIENKNSQRSNQSNNA